MPRHKLIGCVLLALCICVLGLPELLRGDGTCYDRCFDRLHFKDCIGDKECYTYSDPDCQSCGFFAPCYRDNNDPEPMPPDNCEEDKNVPLNRKYTMDCKEKCKCDDKVVSEATAGTGGTFEETGRNRYRCRPKSVEP